jgi:MarR family transcriptional regulator, organic hydroperoxide resistance regulator
MSSAKDRESADILFALMGVASRGLKASAEARLAAYGVHAGQQFVLDQLWARDGQTTGKIAEAIGVEGPTVVRAVQRMEANGLVERRPHPDDKRLVMVCLTEKGRRIQQDVRQTMSDLGKAALRGVDEAARAGFLAVLSRIAANVSRET